MSKKRRILIDCFCYVLLMGASFKWGNNWAVGVAVAVFMVYGGFVFRSYWKERQIKKAQELDFIRSHC